MMIFLILQKFLKSNDSIRLIKIDKSKNLAFVNASDYYDKMHEEFPRSKFVKIERDPTSKDIADFYESIKILKPYLSCNIIDVSNLL